MTPAEQLEWTHVRETRLGSLCETGHPTPEQIKIADEEADYYIRRLREFAEEPKLNL